MPTITDWIVAISTVVYVVATIFITQANRKAASLSEKQIKESREQFEKQQRLLIRPYLNAYVARDGESIDNKEHYYIVIDKTTGMSCKDCREISIRNIGNGSAKDIIINYSIDGETESSRDFPIRNGFLLLNKQYVFDVYFSRFKEISICCYYTDLYDNKYKQEMKIYNDPEQNDIVAQTFDPQLV